MSPTRPDSRRRPSLRAASWLLLTLMVLPVVPAVAQQKPLPIRVEANNADWSRQSGVSTYNGNVVMKRGGLTLTGNTLTVTRINDRGNVRAELAGSPSRLDKQPDREGDDVVTGHAQKIEYSNSDNTIVLRGDAVVDRGSDQITGQVIHYDLDTERTRAEGGSGGSGRVRITIQPDSTVGDS